MEWQKPEFTEIEMNAEIGAYQQERGEGSDPDRIAPAERGAAAMQVPLPEPASARS